MDRPARWMLLVWVCITCTTTACTRPVPRQGPQEHLVTAQTVATEEPPLAETVQADDAGISTITVESPGATDSGGIPAPVVSPSPAYLGTYIGSPTPDPTPITHVRGRGAESYVVRPGEVLSFIAAAFDCTVEEIVAANGLTSADSIRAGQRLIIPVAATVTGRELKLVPDSELVYGPAYIHFDLAGFVNEKAGYLADYTETVEGRLLTGTEIVQLVAQRFSVGPRVLLTLLELQSGWVTQPEPAIATLYYPVGHFQAQYEGLSQQLSWAAVRLNEAYYGWKRGDCTALHLPNGTRSAIAPEINPGTAGVQNCLAQLSTTWDQWVGLTGPEGFLATYENLFGDPFAYTVDPMVPWDLAQPELWLPWESGHIWYLTGGPHGGWADGSGMAALDFVPEAEYLGCTPSVEWVTAAAAGRVLRSENGEVVLDLDGDGYEQSGWTLLYLHIHTEGRVEMGTYLQRGERIGHPSCEGGYSEATHLHFARRYNGEWIPAGDGPLQMVLSGWGAHDGAQPYDGSMTRGEEERVACECWRDDFNGLVSDNAP
jgi:LasA protease